MMNIVEMRESIAKGSVDTLTRSEVMVGSTGHVKHWYRVLRGELYFFLAVELPKFNFSSISVQRYDAGSSTATHEVWERTAAFKLRNA